MQKCKACGSGKRVVSAKQGVLLANEGCDVLWFDVAVRLAA